MKISDKEKDRLAVAVLVGYVLLVIAVVGWMRHVS